MGQQPILPPVPPVQKDIAPPPPAPKTFKDLIIGLLWRDIDVSAGGGKELRVNVISFVIFVAVIVASLILLERFGVLDDIKDMVRGKDHSEEHRR